MSATCPCCGAPVAAETPLDRAIREARLSPTEAKILRIVAQRPGISARDLTDAVYAGARDGGPIWAYQCVVAMVSKIRQKLARTDVALLSGRGWREGYRLAFGGAA